MVREELGTVGHVQSIIFIVILVILALYLFAALVRAVRGPRVADRLVAVNMMGTMVMVAISVLALLLQEEFLLDVCLIYAMVSFLAVVSLSKVYIGIYEGKRYRQASVEAAETTEEKNGREAVADGNTKLD